jgi:sRNA-binding regulator protein Hfq
MTKPEVVYMGEAQQQYDLTYAHYLIAGITPVTVFLTNGVKLSGTLRKATHSSLMLVRDGVSQEVFLQSIATIMPQDAVRVDDVWPEEPERRSKQRGVRKLDDELREFE